MATLTVLNFKQQFFPQKWPGTGKGAIEISSWDLKKARNVGDDQKWSVAADILQTRIKNDCSSMCFS